MVDAKIHDELIQQLDKLPIAVQRRVVEFARSLVSLPAQGVPGKDLIRFAGVIDPVDGKAMLEAIEVGCEQVDRE